MFNNVNFKKRVYICDRRVIMDLSNEENVMRDYENDPKMPWNERTWLDTFVKNKAFETHAMNMIVAMHEKRVDDKAEEERLRELKRRADESYVNTVSMLLNLKPGAK